MGNIPKPLEGGHELLLIHQELSGSGEYHGTLRRLEPIVLQRQSQKDKQLVEKPKYFIHRPEEGVGNDSSFGDRRPNFIYQLQNSSRSVQRQDQGPQKKQKGPKNHQGKGKRKANWHRHYPKGYRIPKLEPSAVDSFFILDRTLMEFTAKDQERMKRSFTQK
ncbi:hypothetical protein O181_096180 [Austropuccinia psidii MF-1]|uniref:Uncharacterized protein n=1 Tax=Austropuccinia psidii MF-1 TaxID=1389203 RepID=A0A9Q3J743_9BASI|nr:hypothetical protein [Austropuccinia psidii MF-1]